MPEAGVGGEPVLLLHGFPETSRMWTRLMSELADAGYHCLAPDKRGYSPGARPAAVDDYSYENLAADVHALAEAAGLRSLPSGRARLGCVRGVGSARDQPRSRRQLREHVDTALPGVRRGGME